MQEKFCTYLVYYSGNKLPPFYIGSTSIEKIKSGYMGSVKSLKYKQIYKNELKLNPKLFKISIINEFNSRSDALKSELKLQKLLNVVKSNLYINQSVASPNGCYGRDVRKELHPLWKKNHSYESKLKIKLNHADCSGSKNSRARLIKIIFPNDEFIITNGNFKAKCEELKLPFSTMCKILKTGYNPKHGNCKNFKVKYC